MEPLALYVSVPVASFRVPHAREYFETYPCPPPSTVYGMLLSLVGEPDRLRHKGSELAVGLLSDAERSVVLRTLWRVKTTQVGPGIDENKRPDFQELLTGVRLAIWVRSGVQEAGTPCLADRVRSTLQGPTATTRFGGLSLGESTHLVDEIRWLKESDASIVQLLVRDVEGSLALPVWPDHVGSAGTKWGQYKFVHSQIGGSPPEEAWTRIVS